MQIFPRQNPCGENNGEQRENKRRRGTCVSAVISGAAKISLSYKDLRGQRCGAGVGTRGSRLGSTHVIDSFLFDSPLFCRENRTFSTRALSRDSGWDPVTDLHSLADGVYCSSGQIPLPCPVRNSWFTQSAVELDAISFAVFSGSGRVVFVLLPGESCSFSLSFNIL